jgi:hypothetical protein
MFRRLARRLERLGRRRWSRRRARPGPGWRSLEAICRGVIEAAAGVRATGKSGYLGHPGRYDWRALEVEALIALGRLDDATEALDELGAAVTMAGVPSG